MKKSHILATALIGLTLSGCAGAFGDNRGLYSVHQPVVERNNYALDVNLSNEEGIAAFEQKRLSEWMEALGLGYGDRVSLDYGEGFSNALATQTVADLAANKGLLLQEQAPVTEGAIPSGSVRIIISRSTASVPTCPNWEATSSSDFTNSNHSNFGCASNSNLAAMVADPEDLVRGSDKSTSDPTNGKRAIDAFNERPRRAGEVGNTAGAGGGGGGGGGGQ